MSIPFLEILSIFALIVFFGPLIFVFCVSRPRAGGAPSPSPPDSVTRSAYPLGEFNVCDGCGYETEVFRDESRGGNLFCERCWFDLEYQDYQESEA